MYSHLCKAEYHFPTVDWKNHAIYQVQVLDERYHPSYHLLDAILWWSEINANEDGFWYGTSLSLPIPMQN